MRLAILLTGLIFAVLITSCSEPELALTPDQAWDFNVEERLSKIRTFFPVCEPDQNPRNHIYVLYAHPDSIWMKGKSYQLKDLDELRLRLNEIRNNDEGRDDWPESLEKSTVIMDADSAYWWMMRDSANVRAPLLFAFNELLASVIFTEFDSIAKERFGRSVRDLEPTELEEIRQERCPVIALHTLSMEALRETGILRLLPPPAKELASQPIIAENNVLEVYVAEGDMLFVEGTLVDIEDLKAIAKDFYLRRGENSPDSICYRLDQLQDSLHTAKLNLQKNPELLEAKKNAVKWRNKVIAAELLGDFCALANDAVISLQNDRRASYNLYIRVQNELADAVNEIRDDYSQAYFGVNYSSLDEQNPEDQKKLIAIRQLAPQRVSEAEPID